MSTLQKVLRAVCCLRVCEFARRSAPFLSFLLPLSAFAQATWIAPPGKVGCPVNQWTYLRKIVTLHRLPADATLHMAADSNARMWINGHIVRRKVTRFFEANIATETIDARPWLHHGANTVVVLHHSWGPIVTFQRNGCTQVGVYVASSWVHTDGSWRTRRAEELAPNDKQITGMPPGRGDHRIRFAQFIDGMRLPPAAMFQSRFNDAGWATAKVVKNGPWPAQPSPTGTPGQKEKPVRPVLLLAQGRSNEPHVRGAKPVAIEEGILNAKLSPAGPQAVPMPRSLVVRGDQGETRYVTVDFGRPVHGFPFLTGTSQGTAPVIDFAYGELTRSPWTGEPLLREDGWLNPENIVGQGYIDRYTAPTNTRQHMELVDERTARWWTLHMYFPKAGEYHIEDMGFTSSQYPVTVKGSFVTDDPRLQQVVRLSLEHAIVSMSDTYVDTPGREDGQWLEDARLRAELAAEWFGDVRLRQLFLRLVAESQHPDGTFHPFPPSNYPLAANADWAVEWVGALYDDYLWTGDTLRVTGYWPQVRAFWAHILGSVSPTGMWMDAKVFADIRIGVHPRPGQSSGIVTAQLIDRLELSIAMAKATGNMDDATRWNSIHDEMLRAFQRDQLVAAAHGVPLHVNDVADPADGKAQRGYSQAAQAMAVSAGLLSTAEARADIDYAFASPDGSPPAGVARWNNPTYLFRALDALSSVGLSERALAHLLERFSPYLPGDPKNQTPRVLQGAFGGPLPEYWISREDLHLPPGVNASTQPRDATGSHGWNAVGLVWLHRRMLGVTIATPGGAILAIRPDPAGLARMEGTTMTPHGAVTVAWKAHPAVLNVSLPEGVRVQVTLPTELSAAGASLKVPSTCSVETDGEYFCKAAHLVFSSGG